MEKYIIGICRVRGGVTQFLEDTLQRYCNDLKHHSGIELEIQYLTPQQIIQGILNNSNIIGLFLPGTTAGQYYYDELGDKGYDAIRTFLENGGTVIGICAGAYTMGCEVNYHNHERNFFKIDKTMKIIRARMEGQIDALLPNNRQLGGLSDADTASITVHAGNSIHRGKLLYWGGPLIIPYYNEQLTPLATFDGIVDKNGAPALAAVSKTFGQGTAIALSVHAEISGRALKTLKNVETLDRGDGGLHRLNLSRTISASGAVRERLFNTAMRPIVLSAYRQLHMTK